MLRMNQLPRYGGCYFINSDILRSRDPGTLNNQHDSWKVRDFFMAKTCQSCSVTKGLWKPWKVSRKNIFWDWLFSGLVAVSFRECISGGGGLRRRQGGGPGWLTGRHPKTSGGERQESRWYRYQTCSCEPWWGYWEISVCGRERNMEKIRRKPLGAVS